MKKFLILIILTLLPILASADAIDINGIWYNLNIDEKTAEVASNPSKYSGDVVIPESIDYAGLKFSVTSIAGGTSTGHGTNTAKGGAFDDCTSMTSITIPKTIKTVGLGAFTNCAGLIAVHIADFEAWCNIDFKLQSSLDFIEFSSNPLTYAHHLFLNGEEIKDVVIPESIKEVKMSFTGGDFKSVTFHKDVTLLENFAFLNCENLKDVYSYSPYITLGHHWREVFTEAIVKNSTLHVRKKYMDNYGGWAGFGSIVEIPGIDYTLSYYVDNELYASYVLEVGETIAPPYEPSKSDCIFSGWSEIPETMPDHDVTVTGSFYQILTIEDNGIYYKIVEEQGTAIVTQNPNKYTGDIVIPGVVNYNEKEYKVISIEGPGLYTSGAFYQCTDLSSVQLPNGLVSIGSAAFRESGITTIVIPNSVKKIEQTAFVFCKSLRTIELSENITSLEYGTFTGCEQLVSITIPENVKTIGTHVFANCIGLKSINLPASLESIGSRAFANCASLKEIQCLAKDMPSTNSDTFIETFLGNASLYVPNDVVDNYKNIAPWSAFGNIYPISGKTFNVVYYVDGEEYASYELEVGAVIVPEPEPVLEGYTFSGWSEIPETMPADDVIVKGSFMHEIVLGNTGKGSYCSNYDLDFTNVEGIKAYTATGYNDVTKTIWLTRVMEVPAGTGLLVKGDPGTYKIPHASVRAAYANWFVGNLGETIKIGETDGDKTKYYLKDGTFKSVAGYANIGKNKAYLQLPTSVFGGTRSIGISYDDEDGTTSIKDLTPALTEGEGEWYTLQGQRVAKPGKGLYIKNGKKVIVR